MPGFGAAQFEFLRELRGPFAYFAVQVSSFCRRVQELLTAKDAENPRRVR